MKKDNYKKLYFISLLSLVFMILATIYLKMSDDILSKKELYQSYSLVFLFCAVCFLQPESKQFNVRFWKLIYKKITDPNFLVLNSLIIIFSILLLSIFTDRYLEISIFTFFQVYTFYFVLSLASFEIRKWLFHLNLYLFFFAIFAPQIAYFNPFGGLFLRILF